jgi:hypothetical protein
VAAMTVEIGRPPAALLNPGVVLHPLDGFGAQFNTNLFTARGQPRKLTTAQLVALREVINELRPGHSRIFVRKTIRLDAAEGTPPFIELRALLDTIELAQRASANVNLTWWQGPYAREAKLRALKWPNRNVTDWPHPSLRKWPEELTRPGGLTGPRNTMTLFARIIEKARVEKGFDCVKFVTIQNEVNGSGTDIAKQKNAGLSMRLYELLYRRLDEALNELDPSGALRKSVQFVGGDLLEGGNSNQRDWLKYIHDNMDVPRRGFGSVLDGYSIHVYWDPGRGAQGFPQKPETRLRRLAETISELKIKKPVYVTEYGVRKLGAKPRPGKLDGTRIEHSNEAAFQHAWFNALAPQYGCVGLVKWLLYRTDRRAEFGDWGMIDAPATSFQRTPTYEVMRLFSHLVPSGWKADGLGRGGGKRVLVSRFAGPNGDQSVAILNNADRPLEIRVEGLKEATRYFAVDWNRDGSGALNPLPEETTAAGGVTVKVPRHGMVALATQPLGL